MLQTTRIATSLQFVVMVVVVNTKRVPDRSISCRVSFKGTQIDRIKVNDSKNMELMVGEFSL